MVEVNSAYKYDRYDNIWLKSLCVMSNVKGFDTQDRQARLITKIFISLYTYDTHMDQKNCSINYTKNVCECVCVCVCVCVI